MITIFSYILYIIIQYIVTIKKKSRSILIIIIIGSTVMRSLLMSKRTDCPLQYSSVQGVLQKSLIYKYVYDNF